MKKWTVIVLMAVMVAIGLPISPASAAATPRAPKITKIQPEKGAATVTWNEVSGAAGYDLYRNGKKVATVSSSPHRDVATPGKYTYFLKAFDRSKKNFSEQSNKVTADTRRTPKNFTPSSSAPAAQPQAPSGSLATPIFKSAAYTGEYVSVIWQKDTAAVGVNVYRNGDFVASVNGGTVFNDFDGKPGMRYYLVAYNGNKFSSKSVVKGAAYPTKGASADFLSTGRVTLKWHANLDVRYRIYRLDSGGTVAPGRGRKVGTTGYGVRDFTDPDAKLGASYGLEGFRQDGTTLAMVTVKPNYDKPTFVQFDLDVTTHPGTTLLTWEAPVGLRKPLYTVRKMRAGSDKVLGEWKTRALSLVVENRANPNDVYSVVAEKHGGIVAVSSIVRANGKCGALCNQDQARQQIDFGNGRAETQTVYDDSNDGLGHVSIMPGPAKGLKLLRNVVQSVATGATSSHAVGTLGQTPSGPWTHGQQTIVNGNTVVVIDMVTGVQTSTTYHGDGGPNTTVVTTVSTPSATEPAHDPQGRPITDGNGVAVQAAVPNSPMTNHTTVTLPNGTTVTETTVTSPTGGTYRPSSQPSSTPQPPSSGADDDEDDKPETNPYDTDEDGKPIPGHRSLDTKPSGVNAYRYSGTTGEVTWKRYSAPSDHKIVKYRITRDGKTLATLDARSFYMKDLKPGRSYNIHIYAVDARGNESPGRHIKLRTS